MPSAPAARARSASSELSCSASSNSPVGSRQLRVRSSDAVFGSKGNPRSGESLCLLKDGQARLTSPRNHQAPTQRGEHVGALVRVVVEGLHGRGSFSDLESTVQVAQQDECHGGVGEKRSGPPAVVLRGPVGLVEEQSGR